MKGHVWDRKGCMREVFLAGNLAFKIPKFTYGWRSFLWGLLANMQERDWGRTRWVELCPILFSLPGGWLIVMRRAAPLSCDEWDDFDAEAFCKIDACELPVEHKIDSFGKIDGRIVAVDYGG